MPASSRHSELTRAVPPCNGRLEPMRVAVLSMHTSPLTKPGTGDAGGMNVYIAQTSHALVDRGVEVEIFTRATSSDQPPRVEPRDGLTVHHIPAGPFDGLTKDDLPSQVCAFTSGVLRAEAAKPRGYFDLIHSHYWLSGQAGWLARDRWNVPLVHSAHTLAKVKNLHLAAHDSPEPFTRVVGEEQVVAEADALVANTSIEAQELIDLYGADADKVTVTPPGVHTETFHPRDCAAAREKLGLPHDAYVLGFAGRIQALKAPDLLVRALARLRDDNPALGKRIRLLVVGGPSGSATQYPQRLHDLVEELGLSDAVHFMPPRHGDALAEVFAACDFVCMPSHNETFGLVALEAQACGTPVIAAAVGGLVTAVDDGRSGILVDTHDSRDWASVLERTLADPDMRSRLTRGALSHARRFTWNNTAANLLRTYRASLLRHKQLRVAQRLLPSAHGGNAAGSRHRVGSHRRQFLCRGAARRA